MIEKIIKWKIIFDNNSYFIDIKGQTIPLDYHNKNLLNKYIWDEVEITFQKEENKRNHSIKSIKSWIIFDKIWILRKNDKNEFYLENEIWNQEVIKNNDFSEIDIINFLNRYIKLQFDKDEETYKNWKLIKEYPLKEQYDGVFKITDNQYYFIINWHKKNKKQKVLNISKENFNLESLKLFSGKVWTIFFSIDDENWNWAMTDLKFEDSIFSKIMNKMNFSFNLSYIKYWIWALCFLFWIYFMFIDKFQDINPNENIKTTEIVAWKNTQTQQLSLSWTDSKTRICELTNEDPINPKLWVLVTYDDLLNRTNEIVCYQYDYNIKNIRIKIINDYIQNIESVIKIRNKIKEIKSEQTHISLELVCKKTEQDNCGKTMKNLISLLWKENISNITFSFSDFDPYYDSVVQGSWNTWAPVVFTKNDLSSETLKSVSQEKYQRRIYFSYYWFITQNILLKNIDYSSNWIPKSYWIYSWNIDNQNFLFPSLKSLDWDTNIFNYFDVYLSSSDLKNNLKEYLLSNVNDEHVEYNILLDKNYQNAKEDLLFFSSFETKKINVVFIKL